MLCYFLRKETSNDIKPNMLKLGFVSGKGLLQYIQ